MEPVQQIGTQEQPATKNKPWGLIGIGVAILGLSLVGGVITLGSKQDAQVEGVVESSSEISTPGPTVLPSIEPLPSPEPSSSPSPNPLSSSYSGSVVKEIPSNPPAKASVKPSAIVESNVATNTGMCQFSCSSPDKDCKDFSSHAQAQTFFDCCGFSAQNDPMDLDSVSVGDGVACESI